jgi:hypothetical protein
VGLFSAPVGNLEAGFKTAFIDTRSGGDLQGNLPTIKKRRIALQQENKKSNCAKAEDSFHL